jgi:hypothetical protein
MSILSSISRPTRSLMFIKVKIKKHKRFKVGRETGLRLSNGNLSTLTKMTKNRRIEQKARTRNSVCKSTDHSILNQECQWADLSNAGEETTLFCPTLSRENLVCNSTSMKFPRR